MKALKILLLIFLVTACKQNDTPTTITIKGNLKNLPDGKLILSQIYPPLKIDSTITKNGVFSFSLSTTKFPEPMISVLNHYDKNGTQRFFVFPTKLERNTLTTNAFMTEDNVQIEGTLKEIHFVVNNSSNFKTVKPDRPIITGRQTQAMYNDTLRFNTIGRVKKIKELLQENSYSYYYLYELKKRVHHFNDEQLSDLLNTFDEEIQESRTGRELREYVENRKSKKLNAETLLINPEGKLQPVLKKGATLNMVVLWASWCGPCRAEIPQLKKIYQEFSSNSNFNMVSISVDSDKQKWINALGVLKMTWQQLLITPEANTYSKELFSFDNRIPTTLFVDNQGKIIKKYQGYDEKSLVEFTDFITKSL